MIMIYSYFLAIKHKIEIGCISITRSCAWSNTGSHLLKAQDKLKTFKGVLTMILPMKNKYIVRSRISQKKFREILKYFAEDIEATKIANLTGISRISINKILKNIRILMASECEKISKFSGEIEIDESYFGAKRVRGKRGRGAANKTPVFGMLKRDGKVYTQIVKNCSASELIPILSQYSELDSSTIYSDCWKAYDGLVDYAALAHYRVKHSKNEFANGKNHINGIENFWGYAKHRLAKFKGIKKENFLLHLKECEFRYNTKTTQENLYQKLLKLIRGLVSSKT